MKPKPSSLNRDHRVRFGWCDDVDADPQVVAEHKQNNEDVYVAMMPLPKNSGRLRAQMRKVSQSLWKQWCDDVDAESLWKQTEK